MGLDSVQPIKAQYNPNAEGAENFLRPEILEPFLEEALQGYFSFTYTNEAGSQHSLSSITEMTSFELGRIGYSIASDIPGAFTEERELLIHPDSEITLSIKPDFKDDAMFEGALDTFFDVQNIVKDFEVSVSWQELDDLVEEAARLQGVEISDPDIIAQVFTQLGQSIIKDMSENIRQKAFEDPAVFGKSANDVVEIYAIDMGLVAPEIQTPPQQPQEGLPRGVGLGSNDI